MSKFGWSLPPGCTQRMIDEQCEEGPCACCGRSVDDCVCPECEQCGETGNPACYEHHGLVMSETQLQCQRDLARRIEEQRAADDALAAEMAREEILARARAYDEEVETQEAEEMEWDDRKREIES